jgi:cystathionine beta-synthase
MVLNSVLDAIGNTPIVRLNKVATHVKANVFAKLESRNPGGSIKDRISWWLVNDAERRGLLRPGAVIIEATSGNTGIGLAMVAAVKGYQCIFTLPDRVSNAKIRMLRAFGARVIVTPTEVRPDDPRSYYSVARRMAAEIPNSLYIDQYNNLANSEHHYRYTGPEILRQMPEIEVLVAGIGTGGTITGTGRYLRERKPGIKIVAVDPVGSVIFDTFKHGGPKSPPHRCLVEGIGKDFIPANLDLAQIDDIVSISDKDAFSMTRRVLAEEGIYSGVSSGCAVAGALRWIESQGDTCDGKNVLVIFPDNGDRYISTAYDDDWMQAQGLADASEVVAYNRTASVPQPRERHG